MRKIYIIIKVCFQMILALLENLGFAILLTLLINKYIPVDDCFEIIERITIFYTLYQIIIYNVLQQVNDIKKDEYLALLTMYKYVSIYNLNKDESIKNDIYKLLNKQLDSGTLNDLDVRNEYKEIKIALDNNEFFDETKLKIKIARFEHFYEETSLNWKYSIFLRLFKEVK